MVSAINTPSGRNIPRPKGCLYGKDPFREVTVIYYTRKRTGLVAGEHFGYIHIYYGEGVGKTTRAVGLTTRAAGDGLRVVFVQFMKSGTSGEVTIFKQIPNIDYYCPGKHPFIVSRGPEAVHFRHAQKAIAHARQALLGGAVHLLVCDEILNTLLFDILPKQEILDLIDLCRGRVDLVMTGRYAPLDIIEAADYVTELIQIKHPYYSGVRARKGIEY